MSDSDEDEELSLVLDQKKEKISKNSKKNIKKNKTKSKSGKNTAKRNKTN